MSKKYALYYWAGFVLIGEVEETRIPLPLWAWVTIGLAALTVTGFGIKRLGKKAT